MRKSLTVILGALLLFGSAALALGAGEGEGAADAPLEIRWFGLRQVPEERTEVFTTVEEWIERDLGRKVTILPEGVFAPYTDIPTNLIFFDTTGPTETIWYYEQPRPEGRRKYSKTAPLAYEEFADCLAWWNNRQETEHAWRVDAKGLVQRDDQGRVTACNLDLKNPHAGETADHRSPAEIVDSIIDKERRILSIMDEIKATLAEGA